PLAPSSSILSDPALPSFKWQSPLAWTWFSVLNVHRLTLDLRCQNWGTSDHSHVPSSKAATEEYLGVSFGGSAMANLGRNLRFGFRLLGKDLGFTSVALLALALGIGANTAIFSVVYATLLAPMPYPNPNQIVVV